VIRNSTDDFETLAQRIVSTLTEYVGAQYGGLYIQKDDFVASLRTQEDTNDIYYELLASYAYDLLDKEVVRFKPGQGLVGQCALEKKVIHVDDVELGFLKISSGLGEATRGSILLVPSRW